MLSIIIPALNEEKYLPPLLDSIKNQDFGSFPMPYEVIVADAGSKDKTVEIAKNYGCRVVPGGLPAKGRNEGAKVAKGETLFFVDSDVILPRDFLKSAINEFNSRGLEFAGTCMIPIPESKATLLALDVFYNKPAVLLEKTLPHAACGIFVKKRLFDKLGGFDEGIKLAEDHYLARRARKEFKAKFGVIKSARIFVSDRRFKKDGWFSVGLRYMLCELHLIFLGPVRSNIFNYRFDHYGKKAETKE